MRHFEIPSRGAFLAVESEGSMYTTDHREYHLLNTSIFFDRAWYVRSYGDVRPSGYDPILHYLNQGAAEGRDPGPLFSTRSYLARRPGIAKLNLNPLVHFLEHGLETVEAAPPEGTATRLESRKSPHQHPTIFSRFGCQIDRSPDRKKVFFVTHEASRTGAPLILRTLISHFAFHSTAELFTFYLKDGDIIDEFRMFSHIIDCSNIDLSAGSRDIDDIVDGLGKNVVLAICNTANVNDYAVRFRSLGIPVITLVHEKLYQYDREYISSLYTASNKVVFPAKSVQTVANARVPIPDRKGVVLPQGLLNRNFGVRVSDSANVDIRRGLGLADESIIVLGCGTADLRKGVDLFISVAQKSFGLSDADIHFVWLGSLAVGTDFYYWLAKDIQASGWSDRIHLVGERSDPAPYFRAADMFALTSREDPFPCVVHEAMSCELPVIAFDGAGGAPEAFDEGCGVTVPYRDLDAMAGAIVALAQDDDRRRAMGVAAKARVGDHYDFRDYFRSVVKLAENELSVGFGPIHVDRLSLERPRVLFFNRDWWISGVNSFAETLIKGLIAMGVNAELVLPEFPKSDANYLPDIPHRFLRLDGMPLDRQWQVLKEFCEQQSPCIMVPNYDYITSAISPALSNRVGIVGIIHSDDVEHYDHANRLGRYWNRFVCSTRYLADNLKQINPSFSCDKVRVIPYGIPVPRKAPTAFSGPTEPLRIVYCARLIQQQKRVLDLVKLTTELEQNSIPYRLTVIGEGSEESTLREAWQTQLRDGSVVMTGRLSRQDMLAELERHEVFLLVSDFEGMPISLLEAMARGLVPVVSDIPAGIPELVLPGQTGFIARVGNIKQFAGHLATLRKDPALLRRLSDAARLHIRNNGFTAESMAASYLDLLEEVWSEIVRGTYRRPRPITWKVPGGEVSPPGFVLKLAGT